MTEPGIRIVEEPYHRLYRVQPTYAWWRPLVALLMTAAFFVAVSFAVAIPMFAVLLANGTIDLTGSVDPAEITAELLPDMAKPWTLLFGLGSIILVLPFVPLALRIAGIRPGGVRTNIAHSVTFRLRWRWLLLALLASTVIWLLSLAAQLGVGVAAGEPIGAFTTDVGVYALSALIVVLLVPLQAATEEYLFRGVALQAFGAWFRWAPVGILLSTLLFAVSHAYDVWGLVQVAVVGAAFAVVTVRTGGLEAAIGMHTVNNAGGFLIAGTGALGPTGMTVETGGWPAVVGQLITMGVWVFAIEWLARRRGVERTSRIGVPATGNIAA